MNAGISIPAHLPRNSERVAVEGYPKLVVKKWIGKESYKSDDKQKQSEQRRQARTRAITGLLDECQRFYGFRLLMDNSTRNELIGDPTGDLLDAVACAVQAAWSSITPNFGIPDDCNELEGWIADPGTYKHRV